MSNTVNTYTPPTFDQLQKKNARLEKENKQLRTANRDAMERAAALDAALAKLQERLFEMSQEVRP